MKRLLLTFICAAFFYAFINPAYAKKVRRTKSKALRYEMCQVKDVSFFEALDSAIAKSEFKDIFKFPEIEINLIDYYKYNPKIDVNLSFPYVYVLCIGAFGVSDIDVEPSHYVKYKKRLLRILDDNDSLVFRYINNCTTTLVSKSDIYKPELFKKYWIPSVSGFILYLWDPITKTLKKEKLEPELGKLYWDIME